MTHYGPSLLCRHLKPTSSLWSNWLIRTTDPYVPAFRLNSRTTLKCDPRFTLTTANYPKTNFDNILLYLGLWRVHLSHACYMSGHLNILDLITLTLGEVCKLRSSLLCIFLYSHIMITTHVSAVKILPLAPLTRAPFFYLPSEWDTKFCTHIKQS
jgi:hypothetical protein